MHKELSYSIVDVFAETSRSGNQLAVVEDAGALRDAQMQSIAREFDFSETSFVVARAANHARVRIFTPAEELPFAGHPTLGTAWVLSGGLGRITLELGAGSIPVEFAAGIAWMAPPAPVIGEPLSAPEAAAAIGVDSADIDAEIGAAFVRCGPLFRLIAVRSRAVLARARLASADTHSTDGAVFVSCRDAHSADADFAARMFFFDGNTIREDPATGSANAAFAAWLRRLGYAGQIIVEQGFEMGRPSRIYAELGATPRIGGRVQPFASGRLTIAE